MLEKIVSRTCKRFETQLLTNFQGPGTSRKERDERTRSRPRDSSRIRLHPSISTGGKGDDGELIQAWKRGMKEKEEQEKASSGFLEQENVLAAPETAEEQLDEIQLFKLMMKREESKRTQTDSGTNKLPASTSAEGTFYSYQGFL